MAAADHPHHLEAFDGSLGSIYLLKAVRWSDHALERTMISFDDVVRDREHWIRHGVEYHLRATSREGPKPHNLLELVKAPRLQAPLAGAGGLD